MKAKLFESPLAWCSVGWKNMKCIVCQKFSSAYVVVLRILSWGGPRFLRGSRGWSGGEGATAKIFTVINGAFWRRPFVLPTDIHTPASPEVKSPEICREAAEQHGQFWKWMRHKAERSCVIFMVQCFFRLLCGFIRFIVGGGSVIIIGTCHL